MSNMGLPEWECEEIRKECEVKPPTTAEMAEALRNMLGDVGSGGYPLARELLERYDAAVKS